MSIDKNDIKQILRKTIDTMCCERCIDNELCDKGCYVPEWKEQCDLEAEKYLIQQAKQSD